LGVAEDEGQESITERVAAILAADAVGYSRLMADDEKATIAALDRARAVFTEQTQANHGRVVDTAGDSVLSVFETTNGAVRASVAIQEGLAALNTDVLEDRQMLFRIGIHLGDIHEKADGTIYGDGVNVAARLEALSEAGGITVSGSVHDSIRDRSDVGFAFLGEHEGKNLKTPVRAFRLLPEGSEIRPKVSGSYKRLGAIAAVVAVVFFAAVAWWQTRAPEPAPMVTADGTPTDDPVLAMPTGPAIAVLPFENLSGDHDKDYFATGLSEQILTELTRFDGLVVYGRDATARFPDTADARDIGEALGVDYVLRGGVQAAGDAIRVSVRLIDGASGGQIWAEDYKDTLTPNSFFALQDDIASKVVGTIGDSWVGVMALARLDRSAARSAESFTAVDCVLRAAAYIEAQSAETHLEARDCLERAVETDPNYVDAWTFLALMYSQEWELSYNPRPNGAPPLDRALDAARTAAELDPDDGQVLQVLAKLHYHRNELPEFHALAKRAIAANPNDATVLGTMGTFTTFAGEWERGIALLDKARALNPNIASWIFFAYTNYYYHIEDYEEALNAALQLGLPGLFWTHVVFAEIYGQLGQADKARQAVDELEQLYPGFTLETARIEMRKYNFPESHIEHRIEGLRMAGVPEAPAAPSRPVIAVLPFDNLSGDPSQEYFADGITEDIITRLAQYPDILVLGRNTTFQFKGEAVDIPAIAETLGADYVVEGSIRRGGDTVRVTAQLLSAEGGTHLWAETFDRTLDPKNIFGVQDGITEAVASRIGDAYGVVSHVEFERVARHVPEYLSSYECILRYFEAGRSLNEETHRLARDCLERVIEIEPNYGEALAFLGDLYIDEMNFGFNATPNSSYEQALEVIQRGAEIEPRNGQIRARLAMALFLTDNPDRAIRETEEALRLSPNNVDVLSKAGFVLASTGKYDHAEEIMGKVTFLNPNYPPVMNWDLAKVYFARGKFLEAIIRLEMTRMEWWYWTTASLAAAHCANGDVERGQGLLDAALRAKPNLAEVYWPEAYFWNKGPDVRPMLDNVTSGLEACGWDIPPDPGRAAVAQ
jgi:adenylate cyclase